MLITLARKPFAGTVAQSCAQSGTGAINIDASRVLSSQKYFRVVNATRRTVVPGDSRSSPSAGTYAVGTVFQSSTHPGGRWPSNLLLFGSKVQTGFPLQTSGTRNGSRKSHDEFGTFAERQRDSGYFREGDSGSAARFFKQVKPC